MEQVIWKDVVGYEGYYQVSRDRQKVMLFVMPKVGMPDAVIDN